MAQRKKIAVIGAGPCGLTATKACKEENLDVVCFERNGEPGGLWRYHDEDIEGVASVMSTTIINTSKEMSAFSDFPPPKEFPNYMHNSKMYNYFMMYAQKFDLLKHIRYFQEVIQIEQAEDFDDTGSWHVTTKDSKTGQVSQQRFDGVMVCIGHHVFPKIPTFPGQEKFKGTVTHTHSLKNCSGYKDQRVVVVGIGNSGVDASVDCTFVAKNVYLSTRRGSWIMSRVGPNGQPSDFGIAVRKNFILAKLRSFNAVCKDLEDQLEEKFDHSLYNLKPKHRILSAHPTMNDALPNCIISGRIAMKGDIVRFEENGILFEGDSEVTEIDAVILATGYHIKFPFLSQDVIKTSDNRTHLYKYCIPPHLKHPTLALIGMVQPIGAIFPVAEMHSRWFMQVFTGKLKLPSVKEMQKEVKAKNDANAKRYVASTRHTIQVDWVPFMDELSSQFGAKPNLWKMAVTDPKLFFACLNGPCLPYQFRLKGPHAWSGARDAILNLEERVVTPFNTKQRTVSKVEKGSVLKTAFSVMVYGSIVAAITWRYVYKNQAFNNFGQYV